MLAFYVGFINDMCVIPMLKLFFVYRRKCTVGARKGPKQVSHIDIGHESHWPETGDLVWELNPGPIKKIVLFGRGSNLGPTKNNTIT